MKIVIALLLSTILSSVSFAAPKVGDSATYDVTVSFTAAGQQPVSTKTTVQISLLSYDDKTNSFARRTVTTDSNNKAQTNDDVVKAQELYNGPTTEQDLIASCAMAQGTPEEVTVPVGKVKACRLVINQTDAKGNLWLGAVPFGVTKQSLVSSEGNLSVLVELKAFTAGK